jgi:hypothetical protein
MAATEQAAADRTPEGIAAANTAREAQNQPRRKRAISINLLFIDSGANCLGIMAQILYFAAKHGRWAYSTRTGRVTKLRILHFLRDPGFPPDLPDPISCLSSRASQPPTVE